MIDPAFVILTGIFAAVGTYLILSRALIRIVIGIVLLGNGVNLLIFVAGRLGRGAPPVLPASGSVRVADVVNPLPQALILTAIVIGFALFAFLAALALRAYRQMDADNTDHMRLSEPEHQPQPPLEY